MKIEKHCLHCNKIFFVIPARKNTAKFCCHNCYSKYPKSNKNMLDISRANLKYVFNKYELEYWYIGLGWTCQKIANYCNVNLEVIWRNLKKHGVVLRAASGGNRGKAHTKEWNEKISAAHVGKVISQEQRAQISKTVHRLWETPEYAKLQYISRNTSPNGLEKRIIFVLDKYFPGHFKFVGDFSFMIGSKCPDFININRRFVLEIFGDYYHAGENPQERITYFENYGYKCVVLWEHECNDEKYIRDSVLKVLSDYSMGRRDGWLLGKTRIVKAVSEGV